MIGDIRLNVGPWLSTNASYSCILTGEALPGVRSKNARYLEKA